MAKRAPISSTSKSGSIITPDTQVPPQSPFDNITAPVPAASTTAPAAPFDFVAAPSANIMTTIPTGTAAGVDISGQTPNPDLLGHDRTDMDAGFSRTGISGLTRYGAISRIYEEFLRELQGPQGMKSYREMLDNDPIIGAIMFAANHLCRKVSFKFKPVDSSPQAKYVADFCGGAIFDDMESAWPDTLSEILTMLPFGWSLLEWRLKRRLGMQHGRPSLIAPDLNTYRSDGQGFPDPVTVPSRFSDGLIGFRSWSLRSQETLYMWEFDEDSRATVMEQMAPPDYQIRRIPLSKAFLFRTQVAKNNPEGRSMLRNAWTSYYMKKNLQIFEGIGIERDLAGYPSIQIAQPDPSRGLYVPDVFNPKDADMVAMLSALKQMVTSVRRDEQEGLVLPWWAEFKLISTGSRRAMTTNDIIARYDQRMAMSVMADFIMLGHEAVGSKALAATKISLFTSALSSFLDTVCAITNRQAVPILLMYNGFPQELAPSMEHGDIENVNLQELGDFIAKCTSAGFNPLQGADAQKAVMDIARLPYSAAAAGTSVGDSIEGEAGANPAPVVPQGAVSGPPSTLLAV